MDNSQFLQAVLPPNDGWFYVVRIEEPATNPHPRHFACKVATPGRSSWVTTKHNDTHGIFFTPFTFTTDYIKNDSGEPRNARKSDEHKLTCQAFWLDLDIGDDDKKYPDQKAALAALFTLCDASEGYMPRPTYLVNSGGGLHAYWIVDEPLAIGRWSAGANRFKQWWIDAGLRFDHTCTADAARVMRLPGTNNMKTGTPRPCTLMNYVGTYISTAFISRWPEAKVSRLETISGLFTASDDTLTSQQYGPKYTSEIVKRCAVFKHIASDHGASCDEPLWKDVLQTVLLTEDGTEWAHKLSDGHNDYSVEGTDAKLAERTHGKGILCASFALHFSEDICAGCPMQGRGHSPLSMGTKPEAKLPYQPENMIVKGSGTYAIVKGEKADDPPMEVLIARSQIQCVEALQEETFEGIHPYLRVTHATGGKLHARLLDMKKIHRTAEARAEFDSVGLSIPNDEAYKKLGAILMNWQSKLREAGQVTHLNRVQGWQVEHHKVTGFVLGDKIYLPDGTTEDSGSHGDDDTSTTFTPVGELVKWQAAADAILHGGNPALHTMLAASMGAPLGMLMGNSGFCASLSYYSKDSGVGKSTSLRVARAVWATPNSFAVLDDTYNGVMAKLKRAPYMPLMWDDPRRAETRRNLRELLFQVAAGRTKQRATVTGDEAPVVKMHTIGMVASNDPLLGELSATTGDAEAKRVLEVRVPKMPLTSDQELFSAIDENFGQAGAVLAQYYVSHMVEIRKQLSETKKAIQAELGGDHTDRFYVNTITVSVVAAAIATKLKLVDFDVSALIRAFIKMVHDTRDVASQSAGEFSARSQVLEFVGYESAYGGIVKRFRRSQDSVAKAGSLAIKYPADPSKSWYYVIESSTGTVRFVNSRFQEWYRRKYDNDLNFSGWYDEAEADEILIGRAKQVSLAIGERTFTGHDKQRCTVVRLSELVGCGADSLLLVDLDDEECEMEQGE